MYEKRRVSYWVPLAILIVLISLIVVYFQSNSNMQVYQGGDETTAPVTEPTMNKIELVPHQHDTYALTYGIPTDWTRVLKDGYDTYIHAPSTTCVQVQIEPYSPALLTVNEQTVSAQLTEAGYEFLSLDWLSNSDYSMLYRDEKTVYIEVVSFDKTTMVKMVYSLLVEHYDRMMDTVAAVIDSVSWQKENPYPSDMALVYSAYGTYEFAYPSSWWAGIQGNTYVAQDPDSGAIMAVMCNESTATYATTSQLDYVNFASTGRNNFAMQTYQSTSSSIYATATYTSNNVSMVLVQYLVATGTHEYMVTFEIPQSAYSDTMDIASTVVNLLKIYR